jgi:HSP20 family protein
MIDLVTDFNAKNTQITDEQKAFGFDVKTNISIKVGLLESLSSPTETKLINKEPFVDIIESNENIKLIALIPGIKKENINTSIKDGFIEVRIHKGESLIYRCIPCNVKPNHITITSFTYNNSVLEIIFKKGDTYGNSKR